MPVTVAPSAEAMQALVDRLNTGSGLTYTLDQAATYAYQLDDKLESPTDLQVDVIHVAERTLQETLDQEDRTSHDITIWVRKKLPAVATNADINALLLVARQIFQRVNEYRTTRVQVRECGMDEEDEPDKAALREHGTFRWPINLRVEVMPS